MFVSPDKRIDLSTHDDGRGSSKGQPGSPLIRIINEAAGRG